ncbi:MAG: preprotein translocase subunit SecG [Spirochaetes bacterium]|nr:preprotein translocase subunit SecG [Spirochaetota bacterium]
MDAVILGLEIVYGIVAVLLILLVLVQGGKAEGLFASAQANVLGGRGGDILTRITSVLATIFIVGALVISFLISSQKSATEKLIDKGGDATTDAPALTTSTNVQDALSNAAPAPTTTPAPVKPAAK